MVKCVICGAETMLIVGGEPMCVQCDQEQERRREARRKEAQRVPPERNSPSERRMLAERYVAAVRQCNLDVRELARATGSFELHAFEQLQQRCLLSQQACTEIR